MADNVVGPGATADVVPAGLRRYDQVLAALGRQCWRVLTAFWRWLLSRDFKAAAKNAAAAWKAFSDFMWSVLWLAVAVLVIALILQSVMRRTVAIQTIGVPKMLEERGLTAEIAAQRLRDVLADYTGAARTHMKNVGIHLQSEEPDIVVPSVGLSLDTVVTMIRTFIRSERRKNISGDLTIKGAKLWLRLRLNGKEFYSSSEGVDPDNPEKLFEAAAERVFWYTHPYIVASARSFKDPAEALQLATRITNDFPSWDEDVLWAYNLQGVLSYKRADYKTAEAALNQARTLAVTHVNLGLVFADRDGDYKRALSEYETATAMEPTLGIAHNDRGSELSRNHRIVEAIAEYGKAVDLDRKLPLAHVNLASAYRYLARDPEAAAEYAKAIDGYKAAIKAYPNDGESLFGLGGALKAVGRYEEAASAFDGAIKAYAQAISADPSNPVNHTLRGLVLATVGRNAEAIAEYREAIADDPNYPTAHANLGVVLQALGQYGAAIDEYRSVVEAHPKDPTAHYRLAAALHADASAPAKTEAKLEFERAIALDPQYAAARISLGDVLAEAGDHYGPIAEYRAAIVTDPNNASAYYRLGKALQSADDRDEQGEAGAQFDKSVALYLREVALDPRNAPTHNNLGVSLAARGDSQWAIAEYRNAVAIDPNYILAHRNLGYALSAAGSNEDAMAQFQAILKIDPTNTDARNALEELEQLAKQ